MNRNFIRENTFTFILNLIKFLAVEVVNRSTVVGMDGTIQVNIAGSTVPGSGGGSHVSHVVGQHKPSNKGLVFDETIQLIPSATVTVYRCPDAMCRYEFQIHGPSQQFKK